MGFESFHPGVIFLFFWAVLSGSCCFDHPVYLALSWAGGFAYCVRRYGRRAVLPGLGALLLAAVFGIYYAGHHHFGVTILGKSAIGNNVTLEALVYGTVLGLMAAAAVLWLACMLDMVTADKVVYLFGRISPGLSLYLAILLRLIPRLERQAKKIGTARRAVGRGIDQGSLLQRIRNAGVILSMLVTWMLEALSGASDAMRSRGSMLRGRTAFSIYRFDDRDRIYVIVLFALLTLTLMGVILEETTLCYDPYILWTVPSFWFCAGYGGLCLLPLATDLWTEAAFRRSRSRL